MAVTFLVGFLAVVFLLSALAYSDEGSFLAFLICAFIFVARIDGYMENDKEILPVNEQEQECLCRCPCHIEESPVEESPVEE